MARSKNARTKKSMSRLVTYLAWACVIVLGVVLLLMLPLILGLPYGAKPNLVDLADVGQAYGAPAALISAFALAGIAFSLRLQQRQNNQARVFALRERRFELVKLALENPRYLAVLIGDLNPEEADVKMYATLLIDHMATWWSLGGMTESALRWNARNVFATKAARDYWLEVGPIWPSGNDRETRSFQAILTEELRLMTAESGAVPDMSEATAVGPATFSGHTHDQGADGGGPSTGQ